MILWQLYYKLSIFNSFKICHVLIVLLLCHRSFAEINRMWFLSIGLIGSLFQIRVKFASVIISSARSLDSLWFRPWFLTNRLKLLKLRWDIFHWNVTQTLVLSNWANIKISVDARLCVYSITFTFTICCKALVQFKLNGQYCFTPIETASLEFKFSSSKLELL